MVVFLPPEQCYIHNVLNAALSLKPTSQWYDIALSHMTIMMMINLAEIMIIMHVQMGTTHSPWWGICHRPDTNTHIIKTTAVMYWMTTINNKARTLYVVRELHSRLMRRLLNITFSQWKAMITATKSTLPMVRCSADSLFEIIRKT